MSQNQTSNESFNPATFDDYPVLYDEALSWPYRKELELPTLKKLLGDLSGLNVLDFGCGPGVITRWLHAQGAKTVIGYDISEGMLAYARQCEDKTQLGIRYLSHLDEEHNSYFDIILAVYVMPYVMHEHDLLSMCQDMFKMLKPGGKLITLPLHPDFNADPDYYSPFGFQLIENEPRSDGGKLQLKLRMPPHSIDLEAYYWSKPTLERTLTQAGFQQVTWQSLDAPENLTPELRPYLNCPHVAIIEALKK
ncbi:class I SAM-dependent methyltransferase [Acinetobacter pragensis]|uniref:class I SAM-dependent methyltransferase n=1 Tax=Acinetobacter pragensis TaxID=1806892 RepID=UPI00333FFDD6